MFRRLIALICVVSLFFSSWPAGTETVQADGSQATDYIVFGDNASESSHSLASVNSSVYTGPFSLPYRRLLKGTYAGLNANKNFAGFGLGGHVEFEMTVDPVNQNYFTVKLWGNDYCPSITDGASNLVFAVDGNYVHYQHYGEYQKIDRCGGGPKDQFFYVTSLIPLNATQGKTRVTIKLEAQGRTYDYASDWNNWHYAMAADSRGIYRAYIHTSPYLDVSGEQQGTRPVGTVKTSSYTKAGIINKVKTDANSGTASRIAQSQATLDNNAVYYLGAIMIDANFVASAAKTTWTDAYVNGNNNAPAYVIKAIDTIAFKKYDAAKDAAVIGGNWQSENNHLGFAIINLKAAIDSGKYSNYTWNNVLNETVSLGGTPRTRKQYWENMLRLAVDRMRVDRPGFTAQLVLNETHTLALNKALISLNSAKALTSVDTGTADGVKRYAYEAMGISAFSGDDVLNADGSFQKLEMPLGDSYYILTSNGFSKEMGHVTSYGELLPYYTQFYELLNNDPVIKARIDVIQKARGLTRYPMVDSNGYQTFVQDGPISVRDDAYPHEMAYADRYWTTAAFRTPAATELDSSLGYTKQYLESGWAYEYYGSKGYTNDLQAFRIPEDWDKIDSLIAARTNLPKLPMTSGEPDFVKTDNDDGLVVIKQGDTMIFANLFMRSENGINALARVHMIEPNYERIMTIRTDHQYEPSGYYTPKWNNIQSIMHSNFPPLVPQNLAYEGEIMPIVAAPDSLASSVGIPSTRYNGSSFVTLRFASYLIVMNRDTENSYTYRLPAGITSAVDLITGDTISQVSTFAPMDSASGRSVAVARFSQMIDAPKEPFAVLYLEGAGESGDVKLRWTNAVGAQSYTVERKPVGGNYAAIATGLAEPNYTDYDISSAGSYTYRILAVNANGPSMPSPEKTVKVSTLNQAAGWTYANLDNTTGGAVQEIASGVLKLTGGKGDIDHSLFAYKAISGDVTLTTQITQQSAPDGNIKKGLMIRSSTDQNAQFISAYYENTTSTGRLSFRKTTNGIVETQSFATSLSYPYWLRLEKKDKTATVYVSQDGAAWTQVHYSDNFSSFDKTMLVGMFTCNVAANNADVSATFANTEITVPIEQEGKYRFINKATGQALQFGSSGDMWTLTNGWVVRRDWSGYTTTNAAKNYWVAPFGHRIRSVKGGKTLDGSNVNNVVLANDNGNDTAQRWYINPKGNGLYTIGRYKLVDDLSMIPNSAPIKDNTSNVNGNTNLLTDTGSGIKLTGFATAPADNQLWSVEKVVNAGQNEVQQPQAAVANNTVTVTWKNPAEIGVSKVKVYRLSGNGTATLAGTVNMPAQSFSESVPYTNVQNRYLLKVVNAIGQESAGVIVSTNIGPLVFNGNMGFESGVLSPWTTWGQTSVAAESPRSGAYSGKLVNGSTFEQVVTGLTPNTNYIVIGYAKVASATDGELRIGAKDFGGTELNTPITATSYTPGIVAFRTGATNTSAKIYTWKPNNGTAYVDDIMLIPLTNNLAANPGFEDGTLGPWTYYGSGNVSSESVRSGGYGGKLVVTSGSSAIEQVITGLKPNTTYIVSGYARVASTEDGEVRIGVKNFGGIEQSVSIVSTSFTQGTVTFTTGATITSAKIYVYKPNSGTAYADDFVVHPLP
jgi:hypothetical protein